MDEFSLTQYAPDGEVLTSASVSTTQLSSRWLGVCRDLLDARGAVFSQSLGSTFERFSIECAGPICQFKVNGSVLFFTVLLTSPSAANHEQLVAHFVSHLGRGTSVTRPDRFPAFLVLNTFAPDIDETDRAALFQLAYHFAGAYFTWVGA